MESYKIPEDFSVTVNAVNDAPVAATGISGLTDQAMSYKFISYRY